MKTRIKWKIIFIFFVVLLKTVHYMMMSMICWWLWWRRGWKKVFHFDVCFACGDDRSSRQSLNYDYCHSFSNCTALIEVLGDFVCLWIASDMRAKRQLGVEFIPSFVVQSNIRFEVKSDICQHILTVLVFGCADITKLVKLFLNSSQSFKYCNSLQLSKKKWIHFGRRTRGNKLKRVFFFVFQKHF